MLHNVIAYCYNLGPLALITLSAPGETVYNLGPLSLTALSAPMKSQPLLCASQRATTLIHPHNTFKIISLPWQPTMKIHDY